MIIASHPCLDIQDLRQSQPSFASGEGAKELVDDALLWLRQSLDLSLSQVGTKCRACNNYSGKARQAVE